MRSQHGGGADAKKRIPCDVCGRTFTMSSNLTRHIKTVHQGEKAYTCEICHRAFSQPQNMRRHMQTVHKGEVASASSGISMIEDPESDAENEQPISQAPADMMDLAYDPSHGMLSLEFNSALVFEHSAPLTFEHAAAEQSYTNPASAAEAIPSVSAPVLPLPMYQDANSSSGGITFGQMPLLVLPDNSLSLTHQGSVQENSQGALQGLNVVRVGSSEPPDLQPGTSTEAMRAMMAGSNLNGGFVYS